MDTPQPASEVERLPTAARTFVHAELRRLADAVIDRLRDEPATGIFCDVAARHLWDEFCWALQEGPFDLELGTEDPRGGLSYSFGTISDAADDTVSGYVLVEAEKLSLPLLELLTAYALDQDDSTAFFGGPGGVWIDGVVKLAMNEIEERAAARRLDLIGPDHAEAICYEVEGHGVIWDVLRGQGEAMDYASIHADALIHPDASLASLARDVLEAFFRVVRESDEEPIFGRLLAEFEEEIGAVLLEKDIRPGLEAMRDGLQKILDA
jgi:hypothetical protein